MYSSWDLGQEPYKRIEFTLDELATLYEFTVDHIEYPDFGGWLWDMERSGVVNRCE